MSSAPSSAPTDDEEKLAPGRIVATIVFGAFAIAFFAAAFVYFTTPAHSLPSFMGYAATRAIHRLYAVGTFLVGLVFTVAAWFALRYRSLALEEALEAERPAEAPAASPRPMAGTGALVATSPLTGTVRLVGTDPLVAASALAGTNPLVAASPLPGTDPLDDTQPMAGTGPLVGAGPLAGTDPLDDTQPMDATHP